MRTNLNRCGHVEMGETVIVASTTSAWLTILVIKFNAPAIVSLYPIAPAGLLEHADEHTPAIAAVEYCKNLLRERTVLLHTAWA